MYIGICNTNENEIYVLTQESTMIAKMSVNRNTDMLLLTDRSLIHQRIITYIINCSIQDLYLYNYPC